MPIHFSESSYFRANKGVDRYFFETYLLPGLERQARIAGGSRGIELPVGENQEPEYLSLEEAKVLALDWLEQTQNLLESDKKKLARLKNYEQFADLAGNIYQAKVKDPNKLITASRLQNIADLRAANKVGATNTTPHYDPGKAIDDYNRYYLKLLSYSRIGIPHNILQQIVSPGIPSGAGNLREDALASVISANISRLYSAGSVGSSREAQDYAVTQELGNIIRTSYPEMSGLLNLLGDPNTASQLREVTTRLAKELERTNVSLADYEKTQVAAVAATDNYLLNQAELTSQIYNSFPSMSNNDRLNLTSAILKEMVSSSGRRLTSNEIIDRVTQKLGVVPTELVNIQTALAKSGVSVSIEYRQNELAYMIGSHHLTAGERNLLSKGINPLLTHNSQERLASQEAKLLSDYNSTPGHPQRFNSLSDAYAYEKQSDHPDNFFLQHARGHFNQLSSYNDLSTKDGMLSLSDRALINRTRFGRWVTDTRSRAYETQSKFFDKWVDIEETITGKKFIFNLLNKWDAYAETAIVTIGKNKIPFFRIVPWLYDRFDEWKKVKTSQALKYTSKWKNFAGKFIHNRIKNYELGGFTLNGAYANFASAQWGKLVSWSLAKTGMTGVLKYAGVSASRTATRLLIKIGGKALAKFGAKALGAIITSATAIGAAIFAIGIVLDVISLGITFIKEFIRNSEFRKTIMGWGAAIGGVFAAINLGGVFLAIGAFFAGTFAGSLSLLILAFTITLGVVFIAPQIQNNIKNTFRLDSEYIPPASSANFGESVSCLSQGSVPDAVGPGVPTRAREIISDLHTGFWDYCNRPTNPIATAKYPEIFDVPDTINVPSVYSLSNRPNLFDYEFFRIKPDPTREEIQTSGNALYWCTYLVQHSYRESGKTGLSYSLWSPTLEDEFRQKFTFVEGGAANSSNVKPGDVIFFKVSGGPDRTNHVGVINNVDPPGFTYFQSNAPTINSFGTFSGGAKDSSPGVEVVGFGRM